MWDDCEMCTGPPLKYNEIKTEHNVHYSCFTQILKWFLLFGGEGSEWKRKKSPWGTLPFITEISWSCARMTVVNSSVPDLKVSREHFGLFLFFFLLFLWVFLINKSMPTKK